MFSEKDPYEPGSVAVDSSGNVYVVDAGNDRIQKFTSDGRFITKWGGQFPTSEPPGLPYGGPSGIAICAGDFVYVDDFGGHRIQKFDSSGNFIVKWGERGTGDGQLIAPLYITLDFQNHVYVVDTQRIQKFTSDGKFITKWGSKGTGDGQFLKRPGCITSDSHANIYVTDPHGNRIQKFNTNGIFILKWRSRDLGEGEFYPLDIATDSMDYVYVCDYRNNRIHKFTSDGRLITKWGEEGSGDGQFDIIGGISVSHDNYVYVSDIINNRIQKFTSDGRFITKWGEKGTDNGQFMFTH